MNTKPTQAAFLVCLAAITSAVANTVRAVGQTHRTDDIIADSISHAWERIGSYDGSGSLEGYLVFIAKNYARNQCRNHGRKDGLTNCVSRRLDEGLASDQAPTDESAMPNQTMDTQACAGSPDVHSDTVDLLDRAKRESELCDQLAALDPDKRIAARRLIAGERATDIADDMGKGKHWVSRIRTELVGPKPTPAPKGRKLPKLTPR